MKFSLIALFGKTRLGSTVAKLVPYDAPLAGKRIGVAKGRFEVPEDMDASNQDVARLFSAIED